MTTTLCKYVKKYVYSSRIIFNKDLVCMVSLPHVWLELAQWFWRNRFLNVANFSGILQSPPPSPTFSHNLHVYKISIFTHQSIVISNLYTIPWQILLLKVGLLFDWFLRHQMEPITEDLLLCEIKHNLRWKGKSENCVSTVNSDWKR